MNKNKIKLQMKSGTYVLNNMDYLNNKDNDNWIKNNTV